MSRKSLIDTGFLLAAMDASDQHHAECAKSYRLMAKDALLPDVVLPELAYLLKRELGVKALATLLRLVANGKFEIVRSMDLDFRRAAELIEQYDDINIDMVDAVIVALAERLKIGTVLTVDRRHFGMFKPTHCDAFEILPTKSA